MKKSRIFMATGAFLLAVSAVFATKANKKFTAGLNVAEYSSGLKVEAPTVFTAVNGIGEVRVYLALYSTTSQTLIGEGPLKTAVGGSKPVYMAD